MIPDKVIYTDGHDVTVTDTTLQVKKQEYRLNGITKCAMMVLQPKRAPGIILLLLGLGLVALAFLGVFSPEIFPDLNFSNRNYSANTIALWSGGLFILLGIIALAAVRQRYAVRIATAEGEKDAIVSTQKEYISQIVDSVNQAVSYVRTKTASRYFNMRGTA